MRYSLATADSTKVTKMSKNRKSLKTAIKSPIIYGQAVLRNVISLKIEI